MMYSPSGLSKIIKINSVICALYLGIRAGLFAFFCTSAVPLIVLAISILFALAGYWFSKNIWAARGVYFLSFLLMLFVTDVLSLGISLCFGLFENSVFLSLWLGGVFALVAFGLFLIYGAVNERIVRKNILTVSDARIREDLKFAVLSDIHYGTIQPKEILKKTIDRINGENYDAVILVGDIAEEHTSHNDVIELFSELNRLKSRYGTFFVHGNHDRQEGLKGERTYSDEEFEVLMSDAEIKIIDDSKVNIGDTVQLIGRKDYSVKNRLDVTSLLENTDRNCVRIVADHQPAECEELAEQGVDICLSAHFHGAQNWPNNIIYGLAGIRYNGKYKIDSMSIYVNAGIAGSKYKIRTHGHCEYLELLLQRKAEG